MKKPATPAKPAMPGGADATPVWGAGALLRRVLLPVAGCLLLGGSGIGEEVREVGEKDVPVEEKGVPGEWPGEPVEVVREELPTWDLVGRPYFPDYVTSSNAGMLSLAGEASLWKRPEHRPGKVIRLSIDPTFATPMVYRVEEGEDGYYMSFRRVSAPDRGPRHVELSGRMRIPTRGYRDLWTMAEWEEIRTLAALTMDERRGLYAGLDGETYTLEIVDGPSYRIVEMWTPRGILPYLDETMPLGPNVTKGTVQSFIEMVDLFHELSGVDARTLEPLDEPGSAEDDPPAATPPDAGPAPDGESPPEAQENSGPGGP